MGSSQQWTKKVSGGKEQNEQSRKELSPLKGNIFFFNFKAILDKSEIKLGDAIFLPNQIATMQQLYYYSCALVNFQ